MFYGYYVKLEVMHRVSVLSPRPSTGTSLHTCTLRRKGKTSFFPVTLCASSSCIIFLCATHTYTHTLMHTHILTSSPPSEIRRERRWEDVQRRLFPLYSPFPSLTHVHSRAHTLSLARTHTHPFTWQSLWQLGACCLSKSSHLPHLRISSQKLKKGDTKMSRQLQNDYATNACSHLLPV